jgi:hypothetical protein
VGGDWVPLTHPKIGFKLILCDAAQADSVSGKLHMLGAGWTVTSSPTAPHAVAVMIQVPWDRSNEELTVKVELLTEDGLAITIPGPTRSQPIVSEMKLEVGRPPGIARGSTLNSAFAVNVAALPLPPGRYQWRATVDGDTQGESFQVVK